MSGLEVIGLAASIVQLADLGLRLSHTLYTYVESVRGADKRLQDFAWQVGLTAQIVRDVGTLFEREKQESGGGYDDAVELIGENGLVAARDCLRECERVFREVDVFVGKAMYVTSNWGNGLDHLMKVEREKREILLMLTCICA
jgi:hypothetical protein